MAALGVSLLTIAPCPHDDSQWPGYHLVCDSTGAIHDESTLRATADVIALLSPVGNHRLRHASSVPSRFHRAVFRILDDMLTHKHADDRKDVDRFLDPALFINPDVDTCSVCNLVVHQPAELSCGHLFCASCWWTWMSTCRNNGTDSTCPSCKATVDPAAVRVSPSACLRVFKQQVRCVENAAGCTATFTLGQDYRGAREHLVFCNYAEQQCRFCQGMYRPIASAEHEAVCSRPCPNKCGESCRQDQLPEHRKTCREEVVECEWCGECFARGDKEVHLKGRVSGHLDKMSRELRSLRQTMEGMQETIYALQEGDSRRKRRRLDADDEEEEEEEKTVAVTDRADVCYSAD
jgi:hypothetical protein